MTETDWYKLIRDSKSELQSEFNEKNRALHKRIDRTVFSLEKVTDKIVGISNNMAVIASKNSSHLDKGAVNEIVEVKMEKHRKRCVEDSTSQTNIQRPDSEVDKALSKVILKIALWMTSGGGLTWIIQKIAEG